jgi:hypothetical protein
VLASTERSTDAASTIDRRRDLINLREAVDGVLAKDGGVSCDLRLDRAIGPWPPAVQRGDELAQSSRNVGYDYRHRSPREGTCRRPTFQTSPHFSHRQ